MQVESDCQSFVTGFHLAQCPQDSGIFQHVAVFCIGRFWLCIHFCWWAYKLSSPTCELSFMNTATINTDLQLSPWDPAFHSFECISRAEIAGCVVYCISIIAVYPTFLSTVHKFLYCPTEICHLFFSKWLFENFFLLFYLFFFLQSTLVLRLQDQVGRDALFQASLSWHIEDLRLHTVPMG